jgi:hypothetical protein
MKHMLFLPALVATLILTACNAPAEFSSPISEPGLASYDERLVGHWYLVAGDEDPGAMTMSAMPVAMGVLDVAFASAGITWSVRHPEGSGGQENRLKFEFEAARWTAHASVIDGETYFNARLGHVDKCLNHSLAETISMNPR